MLGFSYTQDRLDEVMQKFDVDQNGTIDFDEFCAMLCEDPWSSLMPQRHSDQLRKMLDIKPTAENVSAKNPANVFLSN